MCELVCLSFWFGPLLGVTPANFFLAPPLACTTIKYLGDEYSDSEPIFSHHPLRNVPPKHLNLAKGKTKRAYSKRSRRRGRARRRLLPSMAQRRRARRPRKRQPPYQSSGREGGEGLSAVCGERIMARRLVRFLSRVPVEEDERMGGKEPCCFSCFVLLLHFLLKS